MSYNQLKAMIAPSILSADFSNLESEIRTVEAGGAEWLHVDVMDGHFVPNITIGPVVVESLKKKTKLPLDCHLMVSEPERWVDTFAKAGASVITVHVEAAKDLPALLKRIRMAGCKAGVSISPETEVKAIEAVLKSVDLVLVMSVRPGFGGQKFMPSSIDKIKRLKTLRQGQKQNFLIEVDGGVDSSNVGLLSDAGADVFVAGSAIFKAKNRKKAIEDLRNAIEINR